MPPCKPVVVDGCICERRVWRRIRQHATNRQNTRLETNRTVNQLDRCACRQKTQTHGIRSHKAFIVKLKTGDIQIENLVLANRCAMPPTVEQNLLDFLFHYVVNKALHVPCRIADLCDILASAVAILAPAISFKL